MLPPKAAAAPLGGMRHKGGSMRCRQGGFTLLEALVAFVILAMTMAVIYQAAGGSVRATVEGERQTYALVLAESVLNNYRSVPPGGMVRSGELDNGYSWRIEAAERPPAGEDRDQISWMLYDVQVQITWSSGEIRIASVLPEARP